jgi:hydroxyacylglutathione hydrolase
MDAIRAQRNPDHAPNAHNPPLGRKARVAVSSGMTSQPYLAVPVPRPPIRIGCYESGPYGTNGYVLELEGHGGCLVFDPSFDPEELIEAVKQSGKTPEAILLTHAHLDHIAGVDAVLDAFGDLPIAVHRAEGHWLQDAKANLSMAAGMPVTCRKGPTRLLEDGDTVEFGSGSSRITLEVLHVPGHSPGSVAYVLRPSAAVPLAAPVVIGGDALFAGSIGRTDFPGGSMEELARSIRTKLYTLPDETRVLPGHGPMTRIGQEKRCNMFVKGE